MWWVGVLKEILLRLPDSGDWTGSARKLDSGQLGRREERDVDGPSAGNRCGNGVGHTGNVTVRVHVFRAGGRHRRRRRWSRVVRSRPSPHRHRSCSSNHPTTEPSSGCGPSWPVYGRVGTWRCCCSDPRSIQAAGVPTNPFSSEESSHTRDQGTPYTGPLRPTTGPTPRRAGDGPHTLRIVVGRCGVVGHARTPTARVDT